MDMCHLAIMKCTVVLIANNDLTINVDCLPIHYGLHTLFTRCLNTDLPLSLL